MDPHDEYVDHSCSTPLERLSRDVETALRGWHVASGSDRHVSFRHSAAAASSSTGGRKTKTTKKKKGKTKETRGVEDGGSGVEFRTARIDEEGANGEEDVGGGGGGDDEVATGRSGDPSANNRRSAYRKSRSDQLPPDAASG
eukprot:CAMPEP_0113592348 /NCGR_PEP_ID=MMETSP0015_2-20120614/37785_1 /TAXON_ID=2838 /ORGANISM="Odontella" /LENGTH=141 /DNA_ID=CAMNT_0000498851 /DNA_START=177 /DNA_END=599 /DNA_ORIENTATION=- /assembly_acc=CAM_ASM_000160